MVQFAKKIDVETMEISSYDLIPDSWQVAQIVGEEDKPTKNGRMVVFTWEILDGQYQGRRVWQNHNYLNESQKAEQIAHEQFGLITFAAGLKESEGTHDLHKIPMLVHICVEKGTGTYGDKNTVKNGGYKPLDDANELPKHVANGNSAPREEAPRREATRQEAPQQRAAGGGGRPWDRR